MALGTLCGEPLGPLRHARYHPYARSMMGRGLVLGVATWASVGDLALGCTHLESFIGHEQDAVGGSRRHLAPKIGQNRVAQPPRAWRNLGARSFMA